MTADDECSYCQDGRLRERRRYLWLLGTIASVGAVIVVAGTVITGDAALAEMFLVGGTIGWLCWDSLAQVRRLSVPERCPVTDDMIRNAAVRAFAKHLHEYDTPVQREKLPSIARSFIAQRRSERPA